MRLSSTIRSLFKTVSGEIIVRLSRYLLKITLIFPISFRVVHNFVLWRLVMDILPHMIDDYQQKRIEFRKIMVGVLSERHRWSQCVEWTNKKLGMAVGALFIRDNFNHESKVRTLSKSQLFTACMGRNTHQKLLYWFNLFIYTLRSVVHTEISETLYAVRI